MAMSKEHYGYLKGRVAAMAGRVRPYRAWLRHLDNVKNLETRLIWDCFHAAKVYEKYSYQEFDYSDAHVETAMKKIFKELEIDNV